MIDCSGVVWRQKSLGGLIILTLAVIMPRWYHMDPVFSEHVCIKKKQLSMSGWSPWALVARRFCTVYRLCKAAASFLTRSLSNVLLRTDNSPRKCCLSRLLEAEPPGFLENSMWPTLGSNIRLIKAANIIKWSGGRPGRAARGAFWQIVWLAEEGCGIDWRAHPVCLCCSLLLATRMEIKSVVRRVQWCPDLTLFGKVDIFLPGIRKYWHYSDTVILFN